MSRRRVDLTERMLHLRALPSMTRLPGSLLKIVAAELSERTVGPGEHLVRGGDRPSALTVLIEGGAEVAGLPPLAGPIGLGFLPIVSQTASLYDVIARDEGRVLELDAGVLVELVEEHEPLLRTALQRVSEHMYGELHRLPVEALESRLDGVDISVPHRPLDLMERVLFVRGLTGFGIANLNAVAAMARVLKEERHPSGARLWSEGEAGDFSFFVAAGRLSCARGDGKCWRAGPRSVIGGVESLAERPRWYTLTTETPVVVCRSSLTAFTDLLVDDFELALTFLARVGADTLGLLARREPRVGDSE